MITGLPESSRYAPMPTSILLGSGSAMYAVYKGGRARESKITMGWRYDDEEEEEEKEGEEGEALARPDCSIALAHQ